MPFLPVGYLLADRTPFEKRYQRVRRRLLYSSSFQFDQKVKFAEFAPDWKKTVMSKAVGFGQNQRPLVLQLQKRTVVAIRRAMLYRLCLSHRRLTFVVAVGADQMLQLQTLCNLKLCKQRFLNFEKILTPKALLLGRICGAEQGRSRSWLSSKNRSVLLLSKRCKSSCRFSKGRLPKT